MPAYRFLLSISLLLSVLLTKAEELTRISGHAPDLIGHTVYVYGFHDFISESKILLDSTSIGADGKFMLSFETQEIRYVELVSDYIAANLYTQPGVLYDVELPMPESDQPKAFGRKAKTEVIFNNLELDDINALIIDFNYNYELFFKSNYETLRKLFSPRNYATLNDTVARPTSAVSSVNQLFEHTTSFSAEMDSVYAGWDSPYFQLYRSAVLGDLIMNSSATPREIYESYIEPFPFNPQHPEFTRLHERFYKFYLARYSQSYGEDELKTVLNEEGDYEALKKLFAKDDFLADPERMDVVIVFALEEVWASNAMNHQSLVNVLQHMVTNGTTSASKEMAQVMIKKLTAAKKEFAPLDISFEDQFKDQKRISDYKGKPLLIEFWAPWCTSCAGEGEHLLSLMKDYDDLIQVLSVEVVEPGKVAEGKPEKEGIAYTSTSSESEWVSAYQVLSMPHYLFIDADGIVMRDNCPLPSEGLEAILFKLKAQAKDNRRRGVGRKDN